ITGKPPRQPQGHFVKLFLPAPGKLLHGSTHQVNGGRILREVCFTVLSPQPVKHAVVHLTDGIIQLSAVPGLNPRVG
ncbi:hypothetical protein H2429_004820, partial [Salmonella enterica subsp. enterica serovar Lubbock]|nr:hypothetical protein [Salmonella enterica subsp. enterica serovar Lubbock]